MVKEEKLILDKEDCKEEALCMPAITMGTLR